MSCAVSVDDRRLAHEPAASSDGAAAAMFSSSVTPPTPPLSTGVPRWAGDDVWAAEAATGVCVAGPRVVDGVASCDGDAPPDSAGDGDEDEEGRPVDEGERDGDAVDVGSRTDRSPCGSGSVG